jgi:hypothetical protein
VQSAGEAFDFVHLPSLPKAMQKGPAHGLRSFAKVMVNQTPD